MKTTYKKTTEQIIVDAVYDDLAKSKKLYSSIENELKKTFKNEIGKSYEPFFYQDKDDFERMYPKKTILSDYVHNCSIALNNILIDPRNASEAALMCKRKAIELNLYYEWKKPIEIEFCTDYISSVKSWDYSELYPTCLVTKEMAEKYEYYLSKNPQSEQLLSQIKKQIKIDTFNFKKTNWIYHITNYYVLQKISKDSLPKDIVFFPINSGTTRMDFQYFIIEIEEIAEQYDIVKETFDKIEKEKQKEENEKLRVAKLPNYSSIIKKCLKKMKLNVEEEIQHIQSFHEALVFFAVYFKEYPRSFRKSFSCLYNNIEMTYQDIQKTMQHIDEIKIKTNFSLSEKIIKWGTDNGKIPEKYLNTEKELSMKILISLIEEYYKTNNLVFPIEMNLYFPEKKTSERKYSLNHNIVQYDDIYGFGYHIFVMQDSSEDEEEEEDDDDNEVNNTEIDDEFDLSL